MRPLILLLLLLFVFGSTSYAQSCNPASVYYQVRDEKGKVLTSEELNSVIAQLPKQIGDATISDGEVSFKPDKTTYYWPEDAEWKEGTKVPALLFSNAGTCTMKLGEVPIVFQGKKMLLRFNINIDRTQDDRRQVVDSIRLQEGTFELDLTKWNHASDKLIPATHWKKVK